jgi:hypothetical protein
MSKIEVNAIEPQCGTTLTVGASGDTILIPSGATINNQGSAVNFGPTGAVSWNTTKRTTGFTAVAGIGYFCDTTSAAFTVTLPTSPSAGAVVGICDYANTFATNNLTVGRNGSNIGGVATNAILSTNGLSVTFVYVDATQGWIVTDSGNRSDLPTPQFVTATGGTILTCGNYKTHVFTGPGTFTVTCAGNSNGSTSVEYLVVAGGGGGGAQDGGGGGAGGFRQNYPSPVLAGLPVSVTSYPITVGSGGTAGTTSPVTTKGGNGNSSIFSTITSTAGGGGGSSSCSPGNIANSGGSGGGASYVFPGGVGTFPASPLGNASGNTPPVSPPQGNPGGYGYTFYPGSSSAVWITGGGGGGSGAPGPNSPASPGGLAPGGIGSPIATTFFGPTAPSYGTPGPAPGRYFAGGGGAGVQSTIGTGTGAQGGAGGGGNAATPYGDNVGGGTAQAGIVNTGGGGGGNGNGNPNIGGAGGSGIVVIRYKFQ